MVKNILCGSGAGRVSSILIWGTESLDVIVNSSEMAWDSLRYDLICLRLKCVNIELKMSSLPILLCILLYLLIHRIQIRSHWYNQLKVTFIYRLHT